MSHAFIKKYFIPHPGNDHRPYLLRSVGLSALAVIVFGSLLLANYQHFALSNSSYSASVLPAVLVDLANSDRQENAQKTLRISPVLVHAAELKAQDMAAKGYFAHNSPDGLTPWYWFTQVGYQYMYAGENLAIDFNDSSMINVAWMNSPGHRANILNKNYTEIGIATAQGMYQGHPTTFVVQMFGRPQTSLTAAIGAAISHYTPVLDRLFTSPTKMLSGVYMLISLILLVMLGFILFIKHDRRKHNVGYVLLLLAIIACIYYSYKFTSQNAVVVPDSGTSTSAL